MDLLSITAASALTLTAGAYLNARLSLSTDLTNLYHDRAFGKKLGQRLAVLADTPTWYGMLQRVVDVEGKGDVEALWFEDKAWTYARLKDCKYCPRHVFVSTVIRILHCFP